MATAAPIIVVGHKNPDNDSICAAVGYAYLKNELARREARDGEAPAVYAGAFGAAAPGEQLDPEGERPPPPRGRATRACPTS